MRPIHFIIAFAIAVAVSVGRAEDEVDTVPAQEVARAWLLVVDRGAYGDSWDQAAAAFQQAITRPDWEKALAAARGPVGSVLGRKIRSVSYNKNIPGSPAGEYVVIQYDTAFDARRAVETVTPAKEKDGTWKVAGYYIK